jgi:hypothetical protein
MATTNESEIVDFLGKLAEFHATLPESQQNMLDELTASAFADPDVEGFAMQTLNFTPQIKSTMFELAQNTQGQYYYYYYRPQALLQGQ